MKRGMLFIAAVALLASSLACAGDPVPEALGWYVVDGGKLLRLAEATEIGGAGELGNTIYGLKKMPETTVESTEAYFIVYATNAPAIVERIELAPFEWEEGRQIKGMFNPNKHVPLNIYTPRKSIPLDVVPMSEDQRMFKLVPRTALGNGPHGLILGDKVGIRAPDFYDFVVGEVEAGAAAGGEAADAVSEQDRQRKTMSSLRSIGTACESYAIDHNVYPNASSMEELRPLLQPVYIRKLPTVDGWGREFLYKGVPAEYEIVSLGQDGERDASPSSGEFTEPARDIVFANGAFTSWPKPSKR